MQHPCTENDIIDTLCTSCINELMKTPRDDDFCIHYETSCRDKECSCGSVELADLVVKFKNEKDWVDNVLLISMMNEDKTCHGCNKPNSVCFGCNTQCVDCGRRLCNACVWNLSNDEFDCRIYCIECANSLCGAAQKNGKFVDSVSSNDMCVHPINTYQINKNKLSLERAYKNSVPRCGTLFFPGRRFTDDYKKRLRSVLTSINSGDIHIPTRSRIEYGGYLIRASS